MPKVWGISPFGPLAMPMITGVMLLMQSQIITMVWIWPQKSGLF